MPEYAVDEQVSTEHGIYRVRLAQEENTEDTDSPRDYDGKVAVIVADARDSRASDQPWEDDKIDKHMLDDHSFDVMSRWLRIFHGATVVLPLHAFNDWAGTDLTVLDPIGYRLDAGDYSGIAFDTPETRAELGEGATTAAVEQSIRIELDEYSKWATGEVYGYIVERTELGAEDEDTATWEHLDSCWGHIGRDWAAEAGTTALEWIIAHEGEVYAERQAALASDEAEIADLAACELGMPVTA